MSEDECAESLQETLEILSDEELVSALLQGIQEVMSGEVVDFEDVLAELGW